jgi:thiamine kinase
MLREDLEALCAGIVPGEGRPQIQALSVGLVNRTYRVSRDEARYVLRLATADPADINLDRHWEANLLRAAGAAGLAPALRYSDPQGGVLLSEWIAGRVWSAAEIQHGDAMQKIARLLRAVHALPIPAPAHCMSPSRWIRHYDARTTCREELRLRANDKLNRLAELPRMPGVVCHGDLHIQNLVESPAALLLLDWEYAHVAEPLWDIAGWCANGDFGAAASEALLTRYLPSPPSSTQLARLALSMWLYDYICLQWSSLYLSLRRREAGAAGIAERAALLDARLSLPAH